MTASCELCPGHQTAGTFQWGGAPFQARLVLLIFSERIDGHRGNMQGRKASFRCSGTIVLLYIWCAANTHPCNLSLGQSCLAGRMACWQSSSKPASTQIDVPSLVVSSSSIIIIIITPTTIWRRRAALGQDASRWSRLTDRPETPPNAPAHAAPSDMVQTIHPPALTTSHD